MATRPSRGQAKYAAYRIVYLCSEVANAEQFLSCAFSYTYVFQLRDSTKVVENVFAG